MSWRLFFFVVGMVLSGCGFYGYSSYTDGGVTPGSGGSPANASSASASSASTAIAARGSGSSVATTSSGTGGHGCDGGLACSGAAGCPSVTGSCQVGTCADGCCGEVLAVPGTACSMGGGHVCDGTGACVGCRTALDCPPQPSTCATPTCDVGVCNVAIADAGASCSTPAGGLLCNGSGSCVGCLDSSGCTGGDLCCCHFGTFTTLATGCVASTAACGAASPGSYCE